jgi:hypothetical protein
MAALGVEQWIASLRAIRANPSVSPADVVDKTILDTFGRTCIESLAKLNQHLYFSKTCPATSALGSTRLYATLKPWITKLRRVCLARKKLVLATNGIGYSSLRWGTPADYSKGGGRSRSGNRIGELLLPEQARQVTRRVTGDCHVSLPDQMNLPSGETSCKAENNLLQLNPLFVSWLMGWPIIVPITSNFLATEWFRFKQRMRSALFGLLCGPR